MSGIVTQTNTLTPAASPVLGKPRFMATNGGPHTAQQWARVTVSTIVDVDKGSPDPDQCERFRFLLAEALEPFFRKADPTNAEEAFKQFKEVFQRSPWSVAIDAPDVAPAMYGRIRKSLITAQLDQGAY